MSDTKLLHGFVAWANQVIERIRSKSITVEVELCAPSSNQAAILHIDGEDFAARITFWADGSYYAEALDTATAATTFSRHGQQSEISAFDAEFKGFFDHIKPI